VITMSRFKGRGEGRERVSMALFPEHARPFLQALEDVIRELNGGKSYSGQERKYPLFEKSSESFRPGGAKTYRKTSGTRNDDDRSEREDSRDRDDWDR
jgi:hypothetical protein